MSGEYIVEGRFITQISLPSPCVGAAGRFFAEACVPLLRIGAAGRFFAEAGLPLLRIGAACRFFAEAGLPLTLVCILAAFWLGLHPLNNARATRCAATLGSVEMRAAGGQVFKSIPVSWIALMAQ